MENPVETNAITHLRATRKKVLSRYQPSHFHSTGDINVRAGKQYRANTRSASTILWPLVIKVHMYIRRRRASDKLRKCLPFANSLGSASPSSCSGNRLILLRAELESLDKSSHKGLLISPFGVSFYHCSFKRYLQF
jgi:hypothetical protein